MSRSRPLSINSETTGEGGRGAGVRNKHGRVSWLEKDMQERSSRLQILTYSSAKKNGFKHEQAFTAAQTTHEQVGKCVSTFGVVYYIQVQKKTGVETSDRCNCCKSVDCLALRRQFKKVKQH